MSRSVTKDFRDAAREFCREKDFNNVDLIEAAMIKAAEIVVADTTQMLAGVRENITAFRERNNAPT